MKHVRVGGIALRGSGYPNAWQTISLLRETSGWVVRDHAKWLPLDARLWHFAKGSWFRHIWSLIRIVTGGCVQAFIVGAATRKAEIVYLPYPAPFTLLWLSFLPSKWRPFCVADAYISIWDAMFRDRSKGCSDSAISRAVKWFEGRSLRAATVVLVDTEANRQQFIADFNLDIRKVRSIPLAIDEKLFTEQAGTSRVSRPIRVLFVGTLAPLHGVEVILAAAKKFLNETDIEFRLLGDGQQSELVESFIQTEKPSNFSWVRTWLSLDEVASEFEKADICLGVFGGQDKASRVLPFKLYYALAAGKPVITQGGYSLPEGAPPFPALLVSGGSVNERAGQLAAGVTSLANDREQRNLLATAARNYFSEFLSKESIISRWNQWVS